MQIVLIQNIMEPIQTFFWTQAAIESVAPAKPNQVDEEEEVYFDVKSGKLRVEGDDQEEFTLSDDEVDDAQFTVRTCRNQYQNQSQCFDLCNFSHRRLNS